MKRRSFARLLGFIVFTVILVSCLSLSASAEEGDAGVLYFAREGDTVLQKIAGDEPSRDVFGDGSAVWDASSRTLTLTDFSAADFEMTLHRYDPLTGIDDSESGHFYSLYGMGERDFFVVVRGTCSFSGGIFLECGGISFIGADVTFGEDIHCAAAVGSGTVNAENSTLRLTGADCISPVRHSSVSPLSAAFSATNMLFSGTRVECEVDTKEPTHFCLAFMHADQNLYFQKSSEVILSTSAPVFLTAFSSGAGDIRADSSRLSVAGQEMVFVLQGDAEKDLLSGSLTLSGCAVTVRDCNAFADCTALLCSQSMVNARTFAGAVNLCSLSDVGGGVCRFENSIVSFSRVPETPAYVSFRTLFGLPGASHTVGLTTRDANVVFADTSASFWGYETGIFSFGTCAVGFDLTSRLTVGDAHCALFVTSPAETPLAIENEKWLGETFCVRQVSLPETVALADVSSKGYVLAPTDESVVFSAGQPDLIVTPGELAAALTGTAGEISCPVSAPKLLETRKIVLIVVVLAFLVLASAACVVLPIVLKREKKAFMPVPDKKDEP